MARNLYRFYLYTVFIAMLIFATVGLGRLLQPLLAFTPLGGTYPGVPSSSDIVQAVVFFLISLVIASLLGGLHYWLLRRDMRSDPAAGQSAIRAFFLNIAALIVAPFAVYIAAANVINELGRVPANDLSTPASLWSAAHPAHHPDLFLAFDSRAIARRFRVWWPGLGRNTLWWLYRLPGPQFAQFGGSHALGRTFLDRLWILHA